MITDLIINMSDKIQIYQKQEIPEVELLKRVPKDNVELIDTLKQIIENRNIEENKIDGSFFIELNSDELYEIFSLESLRQRQLNKII
jgi:rRNA pseudouridine-1189 N-methylase Emg1 (Nep1/Mra1 family)